MADSVQIKVDTAELEKRERVVSIIEEHKKSMCKGSVYIRQRLCSR